jgi:site-specific DNA-methyltransferase (adenine-specific)
MILLEKEIDLKPSSQTFLMDCMEGMSQYPDKYFDLAVVDPPYGIREDGSRNKSRGFLAKSKDYKSFAGNDLYAPDSEYFDLLKRKSKNQIIWGANHFIDKIPFNVSSPCWIVWDKDNGQTDFADCELAWTSFKSSVRKFEFKWQGMLQGDMKNKEHRIHPTQKPVALYDWIFKNYAEPGMKVLDTHLGSQSSRISAYKAKMDFTGFELDADYFSAGEKRFKEFVSQLTLF